MPSKLAIFDFFCGAGGASNGFHQAGIDSVLGIDFNESALETYQANHTGSTLCADINDVTPQLIQEYKDRYLQEHSNVEFGFVMCPPCQDFSIMQQKERREMPGNRRSLVMASIRLFLACEPEFLFLENVKGFWNSPEFTQAICALEESGKYVVFRRLLCFADYGLPQLRNRVIIVALKKGRSFRWPDETHQQNPEGLFSLERWRTVWDAIGHLPRVEAGEVCKSDPLHRTRALTPKNQERIRFVTCGGDWRQWPKRLLLKRYKEILRGEKGKGIFVNYGRISPDAPCPTILSQFVRLSSGRWGHPRQNRAITLREGAIMQGFPLEYKFIGSMTAIARQIGNAVPPMIARQIAKGIVKAIVA